MEPSAAAKIEPRPASSTVPPLLFVFAAALLWSSGGLFIKWTTLSALQVTFWRCLLALVTIAFLTRRHGWRINRITILTSLLYAALLVLFVVATKKTTAANAIFLQYTAPIYIMIFEPLLFRERFRPRDLLTVLFCMCGMSLFFVGKLKPDDVTGNLVALGSGLCMGFYFLLLRHPKTQQVNRAASVIYGNLLLVLLTLPFGWSSLAVMTRWDAVAVGYLGVVQIGLAYTLFTLGMARGVRSLDAGIVGYIEPVLNPVWVFLFIGERPSRWALLGGAIIILAVVVHTLRNARRKPELVAA